MAKREEPIKVSARPPWLEPRAPFWEHRFVGGNAFILQMLADNARSLEANASAREFKPLIEQAREQLRHAARLHVTGQRQPAGLELRVEVENLTGHKFPTGHPYRRAWLHVRVTDSRQRVLFESGAVEKTGVLRHVPDGYTPHRDVITRPEEVQIYQSVMADERGEATWSLLRGASYLKDNRLPPRGFVATGADAAHIRVRGSAEQDADFHAQANGRDTVTYRIALPEAKRSVSIEVELLYQSVPPEAVARLLDSEEPQARTFTKLFRRQSHLPELVHRARLEL